MNEDSNRPAFILLDTATPVCSVAASLGGEIIYEALNDDTHGQHAANAAPMVQDALRALAEYTPRPDAIVISAGPGSYTGLRIGSSLAKGLCHGFGIPLIAISTLEMMADGYRAQLDTNTPNVRIYPMIDARRMEVYTAAFDGTGKRLSAEAPMVLSQDETSLELSKIPHHFVGNGATKTAGLWSGASYTVVGDFVPEARFMLPRALEEFREGRFADLAYWTPNYLKEYVATIAPNKVIG